MNAKTTICIIAMCLCFGLVGIVSADGPWRAVGHTGTYRVNYFEAEGRIMDEQYQTVVQVEATDETGVFLFRQFATDGSPISQPVYLTFTDTWWAGYGSSISVDGMPGLSRWRTGKWEICYRDGDMAPPVFPKWHTTRSGDKTTYMVLEPLTNAQEKEFTARRELVKN